MCGERDPATGPLFNSRGFMSHVHCRVSWVELFLYKSEKGVNPAPFVLHLNRSRHSAVLQIALNGSEHILGCKLDDDQTRLLSVKWFSAEEIQQDHEKSFTQAGQHVRYMLRKVSDFLKHNKSDAKHEEKMEQVVWKLTFDASNGKLPSFEIATDVEVLPAGLE